MIGCSPGVIALLDKEFALQILFVCTGNICRSPTAERLAIAYGTRLGIVDFNASSAGTRAVTAHPIHHDAAAILEELGGDAANFAARQLTSRIASAADLVLTMTKAHRDAVLQLVPGQLHRTFTLSEAARLASAINTRDIADLAAARAHFDTHDPLDIADPLGHNRESFAVVGAQIANLLPPILELCRTTETRRQAVS
jgi:protein-tyrosine phosphatase